MIKLSDNFTLEEFTTGGTAMPVESHKFFTPEIITTNRDKLKILAFRLETIRKVLNNKPITVHCALRPYNWEIKRGRNGKSQHAKSEAVDFSCPDFGTPLEVAKQISKYKSIIQYDQLIQEFDWVHISFIANHPRMQDLTFLKKTNTYKQGI